MPAPACASSPMPTTTSTLCGLAPPALERQLAGSRRRLEDAAGVRGRVPGRSLRRPIRVACGAAPRRRATGPCARPGSWPARRSAGERGADRRPRPHVVGRPGAAAEGHPLPYAARARRRPRSIRRSSSCCAPPRARAPPPRDVSMSAGRPRPRHRPRSMAWAGACWTAATSSRMCCPTGSRCARCSATARAPSPRC